MSAEALAPEQESRVRAAARDALGCDLARLEPLPGALGTRRFARVWPQAAAGSGVPTTLIARVEEPEDRQRRPAGIPPEPPLEPIRALLAAEGLPVPRSWGSDAGRGVDLLEDLGARSLTDAALAADAGERRALYAEACDLVPRLQRVKDPGSGVAAFDRRLDRHHLAYKAERFLRWALPMAGRDATAAEAELVRERFGAMARELAGAPHRLAHRDLQSANVYVREGAAPGRRLALIDLQGALLAPPEYDLACLLGDSYVELPADEIAWQSARIREELPDAPAPDEFARRFDLLTVARKAKDCALFRYAAVELDDRRYLRHVPVTVRTLRAASRRLAETDSAFRTLDDLVQSLPEDACAA